MDKNIILIMTYIGKKVNMFNDIISNTIFILKTFKMLDVIKKDIFLNAHSIMREIGKRIPKRRRKNLYLSFGIF